MSNLSQRINQDLVIAMKARDAATTTILRSLLSALKYAAIESGGAASELDDAAAVAVIRKQIKQRRDSIESFRQGKRDDLAGREAAEIAVLENYLPASLGEAEILALVEAAIAETGASSKKEMGAVMKLLQEKSGGRADNKILSSEVIKRLS